MLIPLVILCLALLAQEVNAKPGVAPGDFDAECYNRATPSEENEKILLDSRYYASGSLVTATGGNGTWLSLDFDNSPGDGPEKV